MQKVAVYWTLLEWNSNHWLLVRGNAKLIWTSSVYCKDIIGSRWFPIWHFTDNPEEARIKVFVEIYEVDEDCEADLDILEWVPHLYNKKYLTTTDWVFENVLIYDYNWTIDISDDDIDSEDNGMYLVDWTDDIFVWKQH